jgi:hypothetical protein
MRLTLRNMGGLIIAIGWVLLWTPAIAGQPSSLKPNRIQVAYVMPANSAHQPIYALLKERHVLERFKEYLAPLRLPRPLLLKVDGCNGEANAWYEDSEHTVTVCYEYIDEVMRNAPKERTPGGVTPQDAVIGPTVEVFLHEVSHALFDLLKVPILGREEDAADQLAAYNMLQLGKEEARSSIAGVAFMYGREAQGEKPKLETFSDVHGISAQRFYNVLCLAYGADPALFADVVQKGYLPKSRAEGCGDEYKQVDYAFKKLISPSIDQALQKKVRSKKWLKPHATQ